MLYATLLQTTDCAKVDAVFVLLRETRRHRSGDKNMPVFALAARSSCQPIRRCSGVIFDQWHADLPPTRLPTASETRSPCHLPRIAALLTYCVSSLLNDKEENGMKCSGTCVRRKCVFRSPTRRLCHVVDECSSILLD
jgi:hypothetical protein